VQRAGRSAVDDENKPITIGVLRGIVDRDVQGATVGHRHHFLSEQGRSLLGKFSEELLTRHVEDAGRAVPGKHLLGASDAFETTSRRHGQS
jgi:hypothetical protein